MQNLAERFYYKSHPRCVFRYFNTLFFFHPHTNPRLKQLSRVATKQTNQKIYLSTMDLLVPATMKNAAKRDM